MYRILLTALLMAASSQIIAAEQRIPEEERGTSKATVSSVPTEVASDGDESDEDEFADGSHPTIKRVNEQEAQKIKARLEAKEAMERKARESLASTRSALTTHASFTLEVQQRKVEEVKGVETDFSKTRARFERNSVLGRALRNLHKVDRKQAAKAAAEKSRSCTAVLENAIQAETPGPSAIQTSAAGLGLALVVPSAPAQPVLSEQERAIAALEEQVRALKLQIAGPAKPAEASNSASTSASAAPAAAPAIARAPSLLRSKTQQPSDKK